MKDYYQILGVDRKATKEDIKKAFRKLAHQHHPDKGGDEAKFKEISEAYQILSDDAKRSQYDQFGAHTGASGGAGGFNWQDFAGQGVNWNDFATGNGGAGFEFDLGDIFSAFTGGGTKTRRGRDISVDIQINFSEAIFGTERNILINKVGVCDTCKGNGAAPGSSMKECSTCAGKGKIHETRRSFMGTFTAVADCPTCFGKGKIPEKLCADCKGAGVNKRSEEIKVVIPAGIEHGEMIRLSGRGEAVPGGITGDLYIKVHVERHPVFKRQGDNLLMELPIKLTEALLGSEHMIETIDGELTLKIPEGITYGDVLRVRNKGVPTASGKRGDLLVRIIFKTPSKLSKKAKQAVEDLKKEGL
jgi:molecular chaperone DnaJ